MVDDAQLPIRIADGRLMIEEVAASELAARFGTPLYVHSEAQLRANALEWRDALAGAWRHGPTRVLASLKANPSPALRRILNQAGIGCDVFGAAELEIALDAGVDPSQISVNGSTKSPQLIARAISVGARLTVDSIEELEWAIEAARAAGGGRPEVRVRLRPDMTDLTEISEFTESEPVGDAADAYKPGIPIEELLAALPRLDLETIELAGVHAHLGRHTSSVEPFRLHAERLAVLVGRLGTALGGWRPRQIDLGGGYSFRGDPTGRGLRELPDPPSPAEYAAALADGLVRGLRRAGIELADIEVEIEPGRAIYGNSGLHLATVLNVKAQSAPVPRTWVGCDSSEVLLSDLSWEHSGWRPVCVEPLGGDPVEVDVTGRSCGFDTIAPAVLLPSAIAEGDVIGFLATGAYEEALAGNFNSIPRPATVLVSGRAADLIRRRETAHDVGRRDHVPSRLRDARPSVLGVDHVSVSVADIDRSLEFYCELLGLVVRERGLLDPDLVERMTGVPGAVVGFADIELGSRVLELLQVDSAQPPRPASQRLPGAGGVHIALRVDDAAAVHARLAAAGHRPLSSPVLLPEDGSDWSGSLVFYVRDPDGVMLEVVERAVVPRESSESRTPPLSTQVLRPAD